MSSRRIVVVVAASDFHRSGQTAKSADRHVSIDSSSTAGIVFHLRGRNVRPPIAGGLLRLVLLGITLNHSVACGRIQLLSLAAALHAVWSLSMRRGQGVRRGRSRARCTLGARMNRGHVLSRSLLTVSLSRDRRESLLLITLLLLIDLLLFRALTLLLSPQEPVMIRRSISWGRRQGSRT